KLADAMSGVATVQHGLNQLQEARKNLEEGIAVWNSVHDEEPTNKGYQRGRMLAYSHLGDVLGNPNYANLGDTSGALAAFRSMVSVADELYRANPGDQTAAIDYGMALARLAALPLTDSGERLSMYSRAAELLEAVRRKDPTNLNVPLNLAAQKEQAGDLL